MEQHTDDGTAEDVEYDTEDSEADTESTEHEYYVDENHVDDDDDDDWFYYDVTDSDSEFEAVSESSTESEGEGHEAGGDVWEQETTSSDASYEEARETDTDEEWLGGRGEQDVEQEVDSASDTDDEQAGAQRANEVEYPPPTDDLDGRTYTSRCEFQSLPRKGNVSELQESAADYLEYQRSLVASNAATDASRTELLDTLQYFAEAHGVVSGKWLVFAPAELAAGVWAEVRTLNEGGELGGVCELRARGSQWLVAAYVRDWRDASDCERVLDVLKRVCARQGVRVATFKPAYVSALGIYKSSSSNTLYTCEELGLRVVPAPSALVRMLGRTSGPRARRWRRLRKRDGASYYHGRYSSPSLPNGAWRPDEVDAGWVYHHGRFARESGRGGTVDGGHLSGALCGALDSHWARVKAGEHVSSAEKRQLCADLWATAERHDAVVGKWKVFAPARVADGVWTALCAANDAGLLGGAIKLGPYNSRSGGFLICVYCNDFTNVADCRAVLRQAAHCCARYGVKISANFKPDFLSTIGAYRSTVRGYRATYPLSELGLLDHWPNQTLRRVLADHRIEMRTA